MPKYSKCLYHTLVKQNHQNEKSLDQYNEQEPVIDFTLDANADLVDEPSEKESDLHEHEVGGGVEDCEAVEGHVVVDGVEGRGDQVQNKDPPALQHSAH